MRRETAKTPPKSAETARENAIFTQIQRAERKRQEEIGRFRCGGEDEVGEIDEGRGTEEPQWNLESRR